MLELSPQPYGLNYNDSKRVKVITRFNASDLHHDLLGKYFIPESPQIYIENIRDYYKNSGGVYAFKVE
jgi:hypothetical protein